MAQGLVHPSRANELGVYYAVNLVVFFAQVAAMLWFVTALVRLREAMGAAPAVVAECAAAAGRGVAGDRCAEGVVAEPGRTDGLLQALVLAGLAMLMRALATDRSIFAALMGMFFGLAYLTKSFAFLLALLAIAALEVPVAGAAAGFVAGYDEWGTGAAVRGGGWALCGGAFSRSKTPVRFWRLRQLELCVVCWRHEKM